MAEQSIVDKYFVLLRDYVAQPEEEQLFAVAELGRDLVLADCPTEEIAEIHEEALQRLAQERPDMTLLDTARLLSAPLMEMLMAYGLAFRARNEQLQREIAEHEQAEESLRESEERYRSIVEHSHVGILIMDAAYRFIYVNDELGRILGYSREEIIGKDFRGFLDDESKQLVADRYVRRQRGEKVPPRYESNIVRKDGEKRRVEISSTVIRDSAGKMKTVAQILDITERKRAREELRLERDNLVNILEAMEDGVYIVNQQYDIQYVNPVLKEDFGPFEGRKCYEYFHDRKEVCPWCKNQDVFAGGTVRWEWYSFKNERTYDLIDTPLKNPDGSISKLEIFRDITERKRAEEALRHTLEKLREALDRIIQTLALTVEVKDPYTAGHQRRVGNLARAIANEMGLSEEQIDGIHMAGLIHDLGKVGIPTEILSRPGSLNDLQFGLIKAHSQIGYDVLRTIDFPWPVAEIVLQHHERLDGSGYPAGLSGDEIMLEARILAVADVVEAMASFRPYRPASGLGKALEEISQNRGVLYDPEVVDVCWKLFTEKGFRFE